MDDLLLGDVGLDLRGELVHRIRGLRAGVEIRRGIHGEEEGGRSRKKLVGAGGKKEGELET